MAERLATRPVSQQEIPPKSRDDEVFEDIVANYDKETAPAAIEDRNQLDNQGAAELSDQERATLEATANDLGELNPSAEETTVPDATTPDSPTAFTPASPPPAKPPVTLPPNAPTTLPLPTPAPAPTTPESTPAVPPAAPPTAETPPPVDTTERTPEFKMVMVDQTRDAREAARDAADARLTEELNQGNWLTRTAKNVWKGNIFKEYYRYKYRNQAYNEIVEHQDVLRHHESSEQARARASAALVERFGFTQYAETLHDNPQGTGEKRSILKNDSPMATETKSLLTDYLSGRIGRDAFAEGHKELKAKYGGEVSADNILQTAEAMKGAIEHGESMQNVVDNLQIVMGESRSGPRTEARLSRSERVIERIANNRWGSKLPKGLVAGAVTLAPSILRMGSTKLIGAVLAVASFGITSAVFAGFREGKRTTDERAQHTREMILGGQIQRTPEARSRWGRFLQRMLPNRREQMEGARVREQVNEAVDMANTLRQRLDTLNLSDADLPDGVTREMAVRQAIDALSAAEMRNNITDDAANNNEVVGWGNRTGATGDERLQFDLARAELKVALRNQLDDATRQSLATELGIDPSTSTLDNIIDRQGQAVIEVVEEEANDRDRAFRNLRMKRIFAASGIALASGAALGIGAQELLALTTSTRAGLLDKAFGAKNGDLIDNRQHQTILKSMFDGDRDPSKVGPNLDAWRSENMGDTRANWAVTADHSFVANFDGTYNLVAENGNVTVENFKVNPDGTMPTETKQLLESKGMKVENAPQTITETKYETKELSTKDHMTFNGSTPTVVDSWKDNGTEMHRDSQGRLRGAEKNELGLHWTGTGVTDEGGGKKSFHMNISNMTENGSTGQGAPINWAEEAKQGNMMLSVKPLKGSIEAFNVPIASDGSINIPPDHPANAYFTERNGKAVALGSEVRAVRINGLDAQGRQHVDVLATVVGTGEARNMTITQEVPITQEKIIPGYKIVTNGYETAGTFTEVSPVIPVYPRRPLERLGRRRLPETRPSSPEYNPYGYYVGGPVNPEWAQQMVDDRMPELRRDPNARVSLGDGLRWHRDLLQRKDPEYAKEIDSFVDKMPNLANLDANTETIVPILVGASFEYDNIYRTLSLYDQMPLDWKQKTQLILNVNWIDSKENDPAEKAKIDKTRSEVARAMKDFPTLQISEFENVWSQEKLDRGEYGDRLIAHPAQQLIDVAMAAALRAVEEGRMPPDHDILLWKGDADAQGMNRFAGPNMIKAFKDHPEADAFSGGVRWGTERHKDFPGLGFVLNFMEVYRIAAQRAHIKGFQSTFGVNGGARMSTFAAIGGIGHYTDQKESPPDDGWGNRIFAARNPNTPGTTSAYGASGGNDGANDYHRHVGGASIDTDASRFEKVYTSGEPITSIWANVNNNGYQGRTNGLKAGQKEDLKRKPDEVIDRIEHHMSDLISHWTAEPAQVATALAIMLPGPGDLGGKPAYTITRKAPGETTFSLTPQGRKWLISRLQFNSKGQYDPYGDRQARQLYGQTKRRGRPGSRWTIPVKQTLSRMVPGRV